MEQIAIDIANTPRMALAPSHVKALRAVGTERRVPAGGMLLEVGAPMEEFFYVEDGEAELLDVRTGERAVETTVGPGQYIGEISFLNGGVWTAPVRAVRDTTLLVVRRRDLLDLLARVPEMSDIVVSVFAGRRRRMLEDGNTALDDGERLRARSVVIATGVQYRRLPVPRLEEFEGAGVYYAATDIEARFCRDREVVVIGGGNSAGQAAMFLSRAARRVHVLIRAEGLRDTMSSYLSSRLAADPAISVHPFTEVRELHGEETLDEVTVANTRSGETRRLDAAGLFIMIGAQPNTAWLEGVVELNDKGFVPTGGQVSADTSYATSAPGIFAVGDVRLGSVKRVASGVGEGSVVISHVWDHVHGGVQP